MSPYEAGDLEPHKVRRHPTSVTQWLILIVATVVTWLALWFVFALMMGLWKLL